MTLVLGGCESSRTSLPRGEQYYVSLGDSYATGFQQTGGNTRNGFAYQLPGKAAAKGYHLKLVNFACAGASTTSMQSSPGCPAPRRGPGEGSYGNQTQTVAALAFIHAHRGQIGLITISIGINEYLTCQTRSSPIPCLLDTTQLLQKNVHGTVAQLRDAAGPNVPIVGTTYPDVILGYYVSNNPDPRDLVNSSIVALRSLVNPALQSGYASAGGTLVDVTAATGAYIPLTDTTTLPPYGTIPVAVARVCQLTFMCNHLNIHPTTAGYRRIADLVVGALPPR